MSILESGLNISMPNKAKGISTPEKDGNYENTINLKLMYSKLHQVKPLVKPNCVCGYTHQHYSYNLKLFREL